MSVSNNVWLFSKAKGFVCYCGTVYVRTYVSTYPSILIKYLAGSIKTDRRRQTHKNRVSSPCFSAHNKKRNKRIASFCVRKSAVNCSSSNGNHHDYYSSFLLLNRVTGKGGNTEVDSNYGNGQKYALSSYIQ